MAADPYLYDGTDTLRNLLDIHDPYALQAFEHLLTADMAQTALQHAKTEPTPTFATLTEVHYLLLGRKDPNRRHDEERRSIHGPSY